MNSSSPIRRMVYNTKSQVVCAGDGMSVRVIELFQHAVAKL